MADGEGVSKSAKRRAAKKARDAGGEEAASAPQPAPAKPAGAAPPVASGGYPAPTAKAKAKAQAVAPAASAQPKAQPKAAAKAEPEQKVAVKSAAKAASKAKGKATPKAAAKEEPEPKPKEDDFQTVQEVDDGTGGAWETCTGLTKKQSRQKERQEEIKQAAKAAGPMAVNNKYIPGMAPAPTAGQHIPGMAPSTASKSNAKIAVVAPNVKETELKASVAQEEAPKADSFTATVQVPEKMVGVVIGPKGSKLKMIQEKTGVTRIDTSGDVFTITGPADAVANAEKAINDLKEKGYTELAFEDFSENVVSVHPKTLPDLIGKGGVIIMALKEQLKVEINIPKTGPPGGRWKVTIAGKAQDVERAKQVINEIQTVYHSEVTHPGQVHEEIDVPAWAYAWIIGKAGSELRHIQNNYKVRVYIPREGVSINENVVIVGEKQDVPRASAYVQKILSGAADASKGRDRQEKADDGWGDEGEEEEWMKQYMYKRR
eukprot:TRINITY_DN1474_c0_g1_i1.p1 TRINITY_DN1474_c0_g1~~TRINITY_DN1474_c0_g1_i1.p1  ORF type:complete len:488 (+),score=113.70 TRINITY_DN1474_c0_g1_i1:63-1526(+)